MIAKPPNVDLEYLIEGQQFLYNYQRPQSLRRLGRSLALA
jgi:hypothetical protein